MIFIERERSFEGDTEPPIILCGSDVDIGIDHIVNSQYRGRHVCIDVILHSKIIH